MTDTKKFNLLSAAAVMLVGLVLSYTLLQDSFLPGLEGYVQRRVHYERVISKKGLSLHDALYWKEKQ